MPAPPTPNPTVTLTFTANELSQLEAFTALHSTSVAAFIQKAALEAAHIASPTPSKQSARSGAGDLGALWLTDGFGDAPAAKEEKTPDLFASSDVEDKSEVVENATAPKRGVTGEQSQLAKGHGPMWEIRQALGRERVHGLGWTREQLAFVLKLSVVGVRKMEHLGTSPVKSLESRKALLGLARALDKPGEEICSYMEAEEVALG